MTSQERAFQQFADFAASLRGDEKSEAQTFLFHLLEAFGHNANTLPEGSTFEYRVRFPGERTKFADFVWPGRCLIEMKSRGEKLSKHYQQTFDYWLNLVPHRPPYVVLCNFDEFWIYDFNVQLQDPVDRLAAADLSQRHSALNFLFPRAFKPLFGNNWVEVTREAARDVARAFNSLVHRGEDRARARRFILQCVVAMFAEDIGLLPAGLFTGLLDEGRRAADPGAASYDLLGSLFRQMNTPERARGGRFAGVDYFNGGLFATVEPLELTPGELGLLFGAANEHDWGRVQPVIFGTLFEGSLDQDERHALGAHFTYESDIQKIVRPTIVRPWDERIAAAKTAKDLRQLLGELRAYRVLDPACGSGNFLFVAYRAVRELEQRLLLRLATEFKDQFGRIGLASGISPANFYGLDVNENAVETAKVTLMLARRLAHRDAERFWEDHRDELPGHDTASLELERDLPLDNLDQNIVCADALFTKWPEVDAIIGNPPFIGSRNFAKEHGYEYARKVHGAFREVPKMADLCVHWFRRAHDHLKPGQRAGLVGTNTIRQNETREASLDYLVKNGGVIIEAVATQVWSGDAAVHVSIVNWVKGKQPGLKKLFTQLGDAKDSEWRCDEVQTIEPTLSTKLNVSAAQTLRTNEKPKLVFQGQNPVHEGFFLEHEEAGQMLKEAPELRDVIFPYMIGRDLVEESGPTRWIIDFGQREMTEAMRYKPAFARVKKLVMPDVLAKAEAEKEATGKETTRWTRMANRWWQFRDYQPGTMAAIARLRRYIACPRVTKRPTFEFVSSAVHPDNALAVFTFEDDYSFGILQSGFHWAWFTAKCSTLTARFRYTSDTVFDTFPWPQFERGAHASGVPVSASRRDTSKPTKGASGATPDAARGTRALPLIRAVADAAVALRRLRRAIMDANGWSLRDLYRTLETPGANKLRDAHTALDTAVRAAYGMPADADLLAFLLELNQHCAAREQAGEPITPPGLPSWVEDRESYMTEDCISME